MKKSLRTSLKSSSLLKMSDEFSKRHSYPYKIFPRYPNNRSSLSDMFVGRSGILETIFVAENTIALALGDAVNAQHKFTYFDWRGQVVKIEHCESNEFLYRHKIHYDHADVFSFTHHTLYSGSDVKHIEPSVRELSRQHRGYTGYRYKNQSLYNFAHGNWGALYIDKKGNMRTMSKQRSEHTYTIQESLRSGYHYEFVVQNCTDKDLRVEITARDCNGNHKESKMFTLKKFGFELFTPNADNPLYTLTSNFPALRPYIFETSLVTQNYNVFHS